MFRLLGPVMEDVTRFRGVDLIARWQIFPHKR